MEYAAAAVSACMYRTSSIWPLTQNLRARHYWKLNISETVRN